MTIVLIILLSLTVGILVGLLGIGGGAVLVPAMVYLLHYDQHLAQGTSLFILLPPIGLGALREYWNHGQVDLRAGIYCALGFLIARPDSPNSRVAPRSRATLAAEITKESSPKRWTTSLGPASDSSSNHMS